MQLKALNLAKQSKIEMDKIIVFSDHAEFRINYRTLNKYDIIQVIHNPEQKFIDDDNDERNICQSITKDINGTDKLLRIIIEETPDEILVISAYLTTKIKKYWRGKTWFSTMIKKPTVFH